MSGSEMARVVAFAAAVGTVYVLAAIELARQIRGWMRAAAPGLAPRARWTRRVLYATAIIGLACIGYGWGIEPYRLEVTHHRLTTAKLAPGAHTFDERIRKMRERIGLGEDHSSLAEEVAELRARVAALEAKAARPAPKRKAAAKKKA